ncbi:hypothetical protein [Sphaerisporangium aureirubrum]|uniref:Uncharacterized protein n=1 Tax=Sphaerisporangium aureirubrum TaxID=1544736 RepID=A0ABW1NG21_9ACTN
MSITFFTTHPQGPQVNMANGNAAAVLDLLGYPGEENLYGESAAEDFLGRVLTAQALLATATEDDTPDVTDGRWTSCGRAPGYLAGRLAELHELTTWAHHHQSPVLWG